MIIHEILENLIGLHCWDVYHHHDLNLSMSFGQPIMRIREPKKVRSKIERVRLVRAHRLVTVRGEWWWWIISAYWKLSVRALTKSQAQVLLQQREERLPYWMGKD